MKLLSARRPAVVAIVGVAAFTVALGGTAVGAAMLTGANIKDGSLTGADVADGSLTGADIKFGTVRGQDVANESLTGTDVLNGSLTGADVRNGSLTGADVMNSSLTGADVATNSIRGHDLTSGTVTVDKLSGGAVDSIQNGVFVGANWGNILRNTIGDNTALLRGGPFAKNFGLDTSPPAGRGSLEIQVGNAASKAAFGNEVDFVGLKVADIGAVGFSVYTVKENGLNNLPNITLEIDPNLVDGKGTPDVADDTAVHYSSMVFVPTGAVAGDYGKFHTYNAADGYWYFTNGITATQTNCGQGNSCTLAQALAGLNAAPTKTAAATVHSVAIGKGRDAEFHGAVDELKIFGSTYNFEQRGVFKHS